MPRFASTLTPRYNHVNQLKLVPGIMLKLHINHLVLRENIFDGLDGHLLASKDVTTGDQVPLELIVQVEEKGRAVMVSEVLNALGCHGLYELCLGVLRCDDVKQVCEQLCLYDATVKVLKSHLSLTNSDRSR